MEIGILGTLALYALSTATYVSYLFIQKQTMYRHGVWLLSAGFVVHTLSIGYGTYDSGYIPVNTLRDTLSFAAWAVAGVFLLFQYRYRLKVMGIFAAPLATLTMGDLPEKEIGNATGLFNLQRNIGGSIGISITTTLLARGAQSNHAAMAARLTAGNSNLEARLHALIRALESHFSPVDALHRAMASIYGRLLQQSMTKAFVHDFRLLAAVSAICLVFVFVLKRVKRRQPAAAH